ncbi:MAG: M3 family oligoendopeptidase [Candidatus Zixiibacteriota bacterium]
MTTATKIPAAPRWDLDSLFPGGSKSLEFRVFRQKTKDGLAEASRQLSVLPATLDTGNHAAWTRFILLFQSLGEQIEVIRGFGGCLIAADVSDHEGHAIVGEGDLLVSEWEKLKTGLEALAAKQSDSAWQQLVGNPELAPVQFYLNELRTNARDRMPLELESLALELGVNGYHAWNRLYDKMAGDLRVEMEVDGQTKTMSLGQLAILMNHTDRSVRQRAFEKMTDAWKSRADLAAMALNAQGGFRLSLYKKRGWNSFLKEPLKMNRLSEASLDAMWHVVGRETRRLAPYIDAKKMLLGIDKFRWYDEFVPCGQADRIYSYDEAGQFIVDNVRTFSPHMADFYRMALDKRWIEAEDRAGKAGGAFCIHLPTFKQSRIFMTYAGTYDNLSTLAHELGHAYHGYTLKDQPFLTTMYPMGLAETASIFSEMLVNDAALAQADNPQEKLMLLDQILQQAYVFFTDIQCRYLFDRSFYTERASGVVGKDRLCELMVEAQRKSFNGLLDESGYHPYFWCSKLHFFITDTPFYNFPYAFGFLFAGGVYARAKQEGGSFARNYLALLQDTGRMTTEEAAKKHLGVDLTKEEFWLNAVDRSLAQVEKFVVMAGSATS